MTDASASAVLIEDPLTIFVILVAVVAAVLWLAERPLVQTVTRILPTPIWIYATPMALTSFGVLPASSDAYTMLGLVLVPVSLFLLTVSSDFRSTLRIGPLAIIMLAAGALGVLLGAVLAFLAVRGTLAPDAWQGFAVLSGAWIGGSANAVAVQQGLEATPAVIGPLLVVDTILGYGWVAFLLFLSGHQAALARLFGTTLTAAKARQAVTVETIPRNPVSRGGLAAVAGAALVAAVISSVLGRILPEIGDPVIVSATTWTILIVVGIGVSMSFTPARRLEAEGASDIGYVLIMVLLASLGARGDLNAFLDAPIYLVAGAIWIGLHALVLIIAARLMKAPPALFALGSVANLGGFVTAPIIASAYDRNLVPTALLMAAIAQIAGIYLPFALAGLLAQLA